MQSGVIMYVKRGIINCCYVKYDEMPEYLVCVSSGRQIAFSNDMQAHPPMLIPAHYISTPVI